MKNYSTKFLGKTVNVNVDRALGTKHPRHDYIYPVNYGFVPNTIAPDGSEVDVYVLGIFDPIQRFRGKCIAVIHRKNDDDDKLIVVPEGYNYSDEQIREATYFQEKFFESEIIRVKKRKFKFVVIGIVILGFILFKILSGDSNIESNQSRQNDIQNIMNSLQEYKNFNGEYPIEIDFDQKSVQIITKNSGTCELICPQSSNIKNCINIKEPLNPKYLNEIPYDTQFQAENHSGYYINRLANDQILIGVCQAENNDIINVMY